MLDEVESRRGRHHLAVDPVDPLLSELEGMRVKLGGEKTLHLRASIIATQRTGPRMLIELTPEQAQHLGVVVYRASADQVRAMSNAGFKVVVHAPEDEQQPYTPDRFHVLSEQLRAIWRAIDALPWHATDPEIRDKRERLANDARELFTALRELSTAYAMDAGCNWTGRQVRIGSIVELQGRPGRILAMTVSHAVVAMADEVIVARWDQMATGDEQAPPQPDEDELITNIAQLLRATVEDHAHR